MNMYTYEQVKTDIANAEGITKAERSFLNWECDKCKDLPSENCQRLLIAIEKAIGSYQVAHEENNPIHIFNSAVSGIFTDFGHAGEYFDKLLPYLVIAVIVLGGVYTVKNLKDLLK